jgi:hypothetical protein
MPSNYSVQIEYFAESHFIKLFKKKHKHHWDNTFESIKEGLERIDVLLKTDKAETICDAGDIKIIKTQFRIDGSKESAKTSGNRCIVAWHIAEQRVSVLLIYSKTDIAPRSETAAWKRLVRDNYPQYEHFL